MAIRGTALETGQLVPHLLVRGVARAIGFYERALGAVELYRSPLPGAKGLHAQLRLGNSLLLLTDEDPESGWQVPGFGSPQSLGGDQRHLTGLCGRRGRGLPDARLTSAPLPSCPPRTASGEIGSAWRRTHSDTSGPSLPSRRSSPQRKSVTE